MPDYDLGRARGRIVIEHDERGYRRAEEAQEGLAESADDTAKAFEKAEKAATDYERQTKKTTVAVDEGTEAEKRARGEREKATKLGKERKKAEQEYKEALDDTASSEDDVAAALRRRNKAMSDHLQQAKIAKKAERELREEIEGVTQALDAIPDKKDVKINADTRDAVRSLREFNEQIMGIRNSGRILDKMLAPEKAFGKGAALGAGGGMLGGLAGLLGGGGTAAAVNTIGGISTAVVELSGLLGTLPGLLATGASAMGALTIGTSGFGDALDAILSGDAKAFAEALGELSANAQDLFVAFNTLSPQIESFRFSIQDALSQDLAGWVKPLAATYMPMLETHLTNVATLLNWAIKDLLEWASQTSVIEDVQHIFGNIESAIGTMAPALRMVADAFLDIFSVSSDFLPEIATNVQEVAGEFRDWIQELRANGGLAEWIRTGIDAFGQLIDIIKIGGSAFMTVMQIWQQTAGGPLEFLQRIVSTFNDWVNSAEGSQALTQFFTSINGTLNAMMPVLKSFGTTLFGTILPMFADLGTAMAPGLLSFFDSFGEAMKTLAPHIVNLAPALNQMLTVLGTALVDVVNGIGPALPGIFQSIADAISALAPHIPAITAALVTFAQDIAPYLPGIADDIGVILPPLISFLNVISMMKLGLVAAGTQIVAWLIKIGGAFVGFMGKLMYEWPTQAGNAARGFFVNLGEQISGGVGVVIDIFSAFFTNLGAQISGGWDALMGILGNVKDKVWQWISELPGKAFEAGKALIEDLMRGIKDRLGSLGAIAKSIVETITDWLPGSPAKKGPLSGSGWTYKRGVSLSEDLASGILAGTPEAGSAAGGLAGEVSGALGMAQYGRNGETSLSGFVKDMMQLTDLAGKFIDIFSQISDTVFKTIEFFTTNPLTGESIFPKKWERTVSDDDLRRAREDKAFADAHKEVRSGKRDDDTLADGSPRSNRSVLTEPLDLNKSSSADEVAKAIIGEGLRRGYSREEIIANLATARQESGFDPKAIGGGGAWHGIFQQDSSYAGRDDPNKNIEAFYDRLDQMRTSGGASDDPFKNIFWLQQRPGEESADSAFANGRQPYYDEISQWTDDMGALFDRLSNSADTASSSLNNVAGGAGVLQREGLQPAALALGEEIVKRFPEIRTIGGVREDSKPYHPEGRALDVMIPDYNTPEGKALGDRIRDFVQANAERFGVEDTIWQDFWQPPGGGGHKLGRSGDTAGHYDHVHITTIDGAEVSIPKSALGQGFTTAVEDTLPKSGRVGLPTVSEPGVPEGMTRGSDGRLQVAETADNTSQSVTLEEQILSELRGQNAGLDDAIVAAQDPNATDAQIANSLGIIDQNIAELQQQDNPAARAQVNALQGIQGEIAGNRGFTQSQQDPVASASNIAGGAFSVAQDVIGVINGALKSVDSAANITDTLVRGVENTEDVMKIIDNVQVFIDFAAKIAQTVSNVAGLVGSIIGAAAGADPSGGASSAAAAAQGVSAIAGIISGTLQTVNAIIDVGQEVYSIVTKYVGRMLSDILGAGQGSIMGNVKMLLDLNDNTLKAWSQDNPEDKRELAIPGWMRDDYGPRNQTRYKAPDLNLYIGPGTDPNDAMNAAMWELKTGGQGVFSGEF